MACLATSAAALAGPPMAWWLTLEVPATSKEVLGAAAETFSSDWVAVHQLSEADLPKDDRWGTETLAKPDFALRFAGDFNSDGIADTAIVGTYKDRKGVSGKFLSIGIIDPTGHFIPQFVQTVVESGPKFSFLQWNGTKFVWWQCLYCGYGLPIVWNDGRYLVVPDITDDPPD